MSEKETKAPDLRFQYGNMDPWSTRFLAAFPILFLAGLTIWLVGFCVEAGPENRRNDAMKLVEKTVLIASERGETIVVVENGTTSLVAVSQDGKLTKGGQTINKEYLRNVLLTGGRIVAPR